MEHGFGKWLVVAGMLALTPTAAIAQDAADDTDIDPQAVEAVKGMTSYLQGLESFEIRAELSYDDVLDEGGIVQRNETVTAVARRPNKLQVKISGADRDREIYYDGAMVTVFGARVGFYAQFDAPATIRETIQAAADKYDLRLPLADLFVWGADEGDIEDLTAANYVGPALIGGRECEQYIFEQEGAAWQIWIAKGEAKLPCKLVIIDTEEEERPQYSATITIDPNKTFADETFAFVPPKTAHKIEMLDPNADE